MQNDYLQFHHTHELVTDAQLGVIYCARCTRDVGLEESCSAQGGTDRRRLVLREIAADAERDVEAFEGRPFTGKVVAEYFAYHAAAIKALAEIMQTLLPVKDEEVL